MERTLVILKPDAVRRGLVGEIPRRFERKGLAVVALKMQRLSPRTLKAHYAHHRDKPFFSSLVAFMASAPSVLAVLEGADAVAVVRAMAGATNAREAAPGTIRGDFAMSVQHNVVHASEDRKTAREEIKRFFARRELHAFPWREAAWVYSEEERGRSRR